jgi:hypothetical protein
MRDPLGIYKIKFAQVANSSVPEMLLHLGKLENNLVILIEGVFELLDPLLNALLVVFAE